MTGTRQIIRAVARATGRGGGGPTATDAAEVIGGRDDLGVLAEAARLAGLLPLLSGQGPLTLFAPSDAAFAALPPGMLQRLLAPAGGAALRHLLGHHLVRAAWLSGDLRGRTKLLETLSGERLLVADSGRGIRVDTATITIPDLRADNGIVHIVDSVMMLD